MFQVYLLLKDQGLGRGGVLDRPDLQSIANRIGRSARTVRHHLDELIARRWVQTDEKRGLYFVKGFKRVAYLIGSTKKSAFLFNTKQIKEVKGFLVATLYSNLARQKKRRRYCMLIRTMSKGEVVRRMKLASPFEPVSVRSIAKICNISISTAHEDRKSSVNCGYMKSRQSIECVDGKRVGSLSIANAYATSGHFYTSCGMTMLRNSDEFVSLAEAARRRR